MTTDDGPAADAAVVLVAAGAGVRLGGGAPKALRLLVGEPLIAHAARRISGARSVGWLVVAAPPGREEQAHAALAAADPTPGGAVDGVCESPLTARATVVAGGETRQGSVNAALAVVPPGFEIVLVHDAARALAPSSLLDDVAGAVRAGHDAVMPVVPVPDTIAQVDLAGRWCQHLDRAHLRAVQTPQGFRRAVLAEAHAGADGASVTDDAGLVARLGVPVHTVPGSERALKITTPADLMYAESLLATEPDSSSAAW